MATVNEKMTALADAVRGKTGDTDKLTLDEMTSAIENYTTDATATSSQIFIDQTAYVNGDKIVGTFTIDDEIDEQENLLEQINLALAHKGNGNQSSVIIEPSICSFNFGHTGSDPNLKYYYTAWENSSAVAKELTAPGSANNVICHSYIIADTSTGSINKSAVVSGVELKYASNDSTMIVFKVTAAANSTNTIYVMTGSSGM